MNYDEKRTTQRIHIEVPLHIGREELVTRDISQAGLYFLTDHLFNEGVVFDFSLDLAYLQPGTLVRLGCQGQVVRVEPHDGKFGVAAKINNFQYAH